MTETYTKLDKAAMATLRRRGNGGAWRCQFANFCTNAATTRRAWRTPSMPAPAFEYLCDEHAAVLSSRRHGAAGERR